MLKKIATFALTGILLCALCSCGTDKQQSASSDSASSADSAQQQEQLSAEAENDSTGGDAGSAVKNDQSSEEFSFADIKGTQFIMSSGAGGWQATLDISADGSFNGSYSDNDMGETGDGYPNGTIYQCDYTGKLTDLKKVNDFTYSAKVSGIKYENEPNTESIKDGVRYSYSEAAIADGDEVSIYLKGALLDQLPEGYLTWAGYYDLSQTKDTELSSYGIYDKASDAGFVGYDD